jgi:putative transposase
MARMPRLAVAGQPHLVIQRGGAQPVFRDDADRQCYLDALRDLARGGTVAVHAYVLLDDRVMLLASPRDAADLGHFMQRLSRRYVPAFHRRHAGSGALWAGRFQAAALEPERYLLRCIAMIEQAPVAAGRVGLATEWAWSSARHHTGRGASGVIIEHAGWWQTGNTPFEREARHEMELQRPLRADEVAELLDAARGGWPLGSADFVAAAAQASGRAARPRPRGRPRRSEAPLDDH